ncbi:hypothetical protein EYE40_05255 [Glaciihabitans arcticus]|uniref:GH26 domain-containing protein n=1 Tax=Glaciihabitans arcticus TaxID=2668039 RepID=A0A4Q9GRW7_9MICO|nr:glycosyl hydrolase [Glaciihabitans arcticus]TBN56854.1 hypothetical protein EYE40_05255 [Glaciihabitans arcticus]
MSISKLPRRWWALSGRRELATAAGALGIVLALGATSVFVWNSPGSPVRQAVEAVTPPSREDQLVEERNALLSRVVALESDLDAKDSDLDAIAADKAAIQKALWKTEGELDALIASRGSGRGPVTVAAPSKAGGTTITAPSRSALVSPKSPYLGLFTEQAPFNWATYDATASKVGSTPSVVGYFGGWDENFRANAVTRSWQRSKLPILTWESRPIAAANDVVEEPAYSLPKIIGGDFDAYLTKYARDIVKTGLPLGIRLDHEMNGEWYPWAESNSKGESINGNRPGDYKKMWQHVHDIFEKEGANDLVIWIWSPNITNNLPANHQKDSYLASLYPGDEYVDWVGLSAYLRPNYKADNDFSFSYTFDRSLNSLRGITNKPIYLSEIGASEIGGHKATWIASLFEALEKPANADIIGFNWFSLTVTTYVGGERATNDWRIDSRPDSLRAFIDGLARPASRFTLSAN